MGHERNAVRHTEAARRMCLSRSPALAELSHTSEGSHDYVARFIKYVIKVACPRGYALIPQLLVSSHVQGLNARR